MAAKKKTWKKPQTVMVVGNGCRICGKEITNDMSFIIYATKKPSNYSCYKTEAEKEQNAKSR